jgi:hypothetical protein
VGAGVNLDHFPEVVTALKKTFSGTLAIASSAENDWIKRKFSLDTFEQADATMQQQVEFLADKEKLVYAGHLEFTDPKELAGEIKGHMVRPRGIHIANKICFTLGGGEQTFNLGNYVVSADWLAQAEFEIAKSFILAQVAYYQELAQQELIFVFELQGELGEAVAAQNKSLLESILK